MSVFNRFINKADLNKDDERKIRELLESPEVEQIFNRAEQSILDKRAALRKQLDTIDQRHDRGIADAVAACVAAVKERDAAEARFNAAKEAAWNAQVTVDSLDRVKLAEDGTLRGELMESRDSRLSDFRLHLDDAWQKLRHLTQITEIRHRGWTGERSIEYLTNADQVQECRNLVEAAIADIDAMALLPLSRIDVSERLTGWTHKLTPKLEAFSLPCPSLRQDGEVELPHTGRRRMIDVLRDNGMAEIGDVPPDEAADLNRPKSPARRR
ncbi:hypothetical protein KKP06_24675 [Ralstonia pickettii]|uniref:hypothetical protein n=1 Tax=Ralstonia pickettii TaxID=329 RepID=UPI001BE4BF63|nr:hypothetical protein [Ralstonia pickettii]MBT2181000.1 hypothetical protein [Ralstonia pickettii]